VRRSRSIKTYIVELGSSLVEIFAWARPVRKLQGMAVKNVRAAAQASSATRTTWLNGAGAYGDSVAAAGELSEAKRDPTPIPASAQSPLRLS